MKFTIVRTEQPTQTPGEMFLDGKHFGYMLEDIVRPNGEYVHAETAISYAIYEIIMTVSQRFKMVMPLLISPKDGKKVLFGGRPVEECGVRIHGGNTTEDTEGCPLLGANQDKVTLHPYNCATVNAEFRKLVTAAIAKHERVFLEIVKKQ